MLLLAAIRVDRHWWYCFIITLWLVCPWHRLDGLYKRLCPCAQLTIYAISYEWSKERSFARRTDPKPRNASIEGLLRGVGGGEGEGGRMNGESSGLVDNCVASPAVGEPGRDEVDGRAETFPMSSVNHGGDESELFA